MLRSITDTAAGLGADGRTWQRVFGSPSRGFAALSEDIMRPILHVPHHPLRLLRFGLPAAMPATLLARKFRSEEARALWGGCAAHAFSPLSQPMSSSVGMALICAGHRYGWPVARGGSRAICDALAAVVREHGGNFETGRRVTLAVGATSGGRGRARPGARRGRRDRRRAAARARRARLPSLPPRPGSVQGRPRRRGWRAVDERGRPQSGHGARERVVRGDRRRRAARSTAVACPSARS